MAAAAAGSKLTPAAKTSCQKRATGVPVNKRASEGMLLAAMICCRCSRLVCLNVYVCRDSGDESARSESAAAVPDDKDVDDEDMDDAAPTLSAQPEFEGLAARDVRPLSVANLLHGLHCACL